MDPSDSRGFRPGSGPHRGGTAGGSGEERTPEQPDGDAPDAQPCAAARQPRHSDGFTMIPPNQSQRSRLHMIAQKGEETLQRVKEANRVPFVHTAPETLGGTVSLAEARQKQYKDSRCSKLQKKLRKEELDRRRRQEEEEELQKMKSKKREEAERLEERKRQDEQRRRELLQPDHLRKTESFLQRFDRTAPGPLASSSATHHHTSSGTELVASKQKSKSLKELQQEHKRVNSAFLDRLEGQSKGCEREAEAPEDFTCQLSNSPGQQPPLTHQDTDPELSCSAWTEEADLQPDYDWALMKLMNSFPDCCKVFLEDILNQCNGDYEQAHTLLITTLS